jgi:uncharacterized protein (TIGR04255 family)
MAQYVRYDHPPVIEVVCGVLFGALPRLRTAHVGVFWDKVRRQFPRAEEAPPLSAVIESTTGTPWLEIALGVVPPFPRSWFLSEDDHRLIQLQRDRFLYNWRRSSPDDGSYPSYDTIMVDFERLWSEFREFVSVENLGELAARQLELTYVSVIPEASIPDHDPVFVDHARESSLTRFLPIPESFEWRTSYLLPDDCGRLHMLASSAREIATGAPIRRLETTARGINDAAAAGDMRNWFDLAHEWVVRGFADVTTERMQTDVWRRVS